MEKITRKKFVEMVTDKKMALFLTCRDEKLEEVLNSLKRFLGEQEPNKEAFYPVTVKSNSLYRTAPNGEKSYLHFNSGDEIKVAYFNRYTVIIYKDFNNIIYVIDNKGE